MPRGGKREGAGRPAGAPNRMTAQIRDAAMDGLTPLEYLLGVMRNEAEDASVRRDAAKAAAPYMHPRLASTDIRAVVSESHEEWLDSLPEG